MKNVFFLWLLLAPCFASLGAQLPADSLLPAPASAPVLLMPRDTLFRVYGRVGSFGPQERAEAIQRRIQQLLDTPSSPPTRCTWSKPSRTPKLFMPTRIC